MSVQTVYSTQAAVQNAPTPATMLDAGLVSGKVRLAHGKYTAPDGNVSAGSTINLVKLPKGARVLPNSIIYVEGGQNAGLGVRVGDDDSTSDDDRYLAASTPGSSETTLSLAKAALAPHQLESECWIQVKTENQALTADKSLAAYIYYTMD